jgi:RHS repeat-associated protein
LDPLNRLQKISYAVTGSDPNRPAIAAAETISLEYVGSGDKTRVQQITNGTSGNEKYFYNDGEGRISDYTITIAARSSFPMTTSYVYDSLSRVKEVHYPNEYGQTNAPRKIVSHEFATLSQLSALKYDNAAQASDFVYNAASQTSSLKIGTGANQLTEEYNFDAQSGLLTNQKVKRANGDRLLDLSYEYRRKLNGSYTAGRTGHLTELTDNLNRNKDRAYEYDAIGRLTKAVGGTNQTWKQAYSYDRYGNRTSVTATGAQALRATGGQLGLNDALPQADPEKPENENREIGQSGDSSAVFDKNALAKRPGGENGFFASSEKAAFENTSTAPIDSRAAATVEKLAGKLSKNHNRASSANIARNNSEASALLPPPPQTPFDFDADGLSDLSVWTRASGNWTIKQSGNNQTITVPLGASGNQIAPGDYDGDGKTDEAVWNTSTGVWTIKQSSNGNTTTVQWGQTGDSIVPADYDGDDKTDIAVWRPSNGTWYVLRSSDLSWFGAQWGGQQFGDIPVQGYYDGDDKADIAVWRPSTGTWWVVYSSNGQPASGQWGMSGDVPVPGDYDGDGQTDLAVWRPSDSVWYALKSSDGQYFAVAIGSENNKDLPVPADYDGDDKTDMAVWTPSSGTWTIRKSSTSTVVTQTLGASGDIPVPSAYIRRSSAPKSQSADIQRDGLASVSYDANTNRISTQGFQYDSAGNQIRALEQDGTHWLKYEYDAANRLVAVRRDNGSGQPDTPLQSFTYGSRSNRLSTSNYALSQGQYVVGQTTYYANNGGTILAEYTETSLNPTSPQWNKSYVYLGENLLTTVTPSGVNGESFEFNHTDRLGTRLVTNPQTGTSFEQAHLPFGTALASETTGETARRFTTYDRSAVTGLDYARNRTYDSQQGRFTQIDPLAMNAATLNSPQTLNLYTYCGNDPINHTDSSGLFWGSFFKWLGKILKIIMLAVVIAVAVISVVSPGFFFVGLFAKIFGIIAAVASAVSEVLSLMGFQTASNIFGIISAAASFGSSLLTEGGKWVSKWTTKAILGAIKAGATLVSKTLTALGYTTAGQILGLVSSAADFAKNGYGRNGKSWDQSWWGWFKFLRGTAQSIASLSGNKEVASYLGLVGLVEDGVNLFNSIRELGKSLQVDEKKIKFNGEKAWLTGSYIADPTVDGGCLEGIISFDYRNPRISDKLYNRGLQLLRWKTAFDRIGKIARSVNSVVGRLAAVVPAH